MRLTSYDAIWRAFVLKLALFMLAFLSEILFKRWISTGIYFNGSVLSDESCLMGTIGGSGIKVNPVWQEFAACLTLSDEFSVFDVFSAYSGISIIGDSTSVTIMSWHSTGNSNCLISTNSYDSYKALTALVKSTTSLQAFVISVTFYSSNYLQSSMSEMNDSDSD